MFYFILFNILSLIEKPKLCINCKFFRHNFLVHNQDPDYGKCSLFTKKIDDNLVTGITNYNKEYYFCSTAREFDNMCGKDAKYYCIPGDNIEYKNNSDDEWIIEQYERLLEEKNNP